MEVTFKKNISKIFTQTFNKYSGNHSATFGLAIVTLIVFACLIGPFFLPFDPNQINLSSANLAPNSENWFGTDSIGRDVFTRVLYGGRMSILIGVVSSLLSALLGMLLGLIAGYLRGFWDKVLIKISELFQTIPSDYVVFIIVAVLGPGVWNLIWVFVITGWMTTFRIVRNEVLRVKEDTYIDAARVLGMSHYYVIFREILPNILSPVLVALTMNIPGFILKETSLSFLGIGVPNTIPTWGTILNSANNLNIIINQWWIWILPGFVLVLFCVSVNFVGDGLRDLYDVRSES